MNRFSSPETEQAVLGTLLDNPEARFEAESLSTQDFSLSRNALIYRHMLHVWEDGGTVDPVSLCAHVTASGEMAAVGGFEYVSGLLDSMPLRSMLASHIQTLKSCTRFRELQRLGERLSSAAETVPQNELDRLLGETEDRLIELRAGNNTKEKPTLASSVQALLERMEEERCREHDLLGLSTGIPQLDAITRGYQRGEIVIVGARSGIGKTSLMTQAVTEACLKRVPTCVFSYEMSRQQLVRRILAAVSGVPFPRARDPKKATPADWLALKEVAERVQSWPLEIFDDSSMPIEVLIAHARAAVRRRGAQLICCDYVQIVPADGRDERLRVSAVSRGLTRLAQSENVSLLALSQLARSDRFNPNRRPILSDLRESGQLENDAHAVVLLHREWDEEANRLSSDAELIVAKQRNGETGCIPATYNRAKLIFEPRRCLANARSDFRAP